MLTEILGIKFDDYNEQWNRMRSMWVAVVVLLLLWQVHAIIVTFLRAYRVSVIKRTTIAPPSEQVPLVAHETRGQAQALDWLVRVRHAGRIARDTAILIALIAVMVQLLAFRPYHDIANPEPIPEPVPGHPNPHYPDPHYPDPGHPYGYGIYSAVYTPFVLTWIIFGISVLQVALFLLVEPNLARGTSGYEYFGPGVYGRREGQMSWIDLTAELIKFIFVLIAFISILRTAYGWKGYWEWEH